MYKLIKDNTTGKIVSIERIFDNAFMPFDPTNTDYENFKYQINHDEAQLEDADGNLMTPEAAKAYVATLP